MDTSTPQTLSRIKAVGTFALILGGLDAAAGLLTLFVWASVARLHTVTIAETFVFQFVQAAVVLWAGIRIRRVARDNLARTINVLAISGCAILVLNAVPNHKQASLQFIAHLILVGCIIWAFYAARKVAPPIRSARKS